MTTHTPIASSDLPDPSPSFRYEDIIKNVIAPFPSHMIKVRPGATTRDKKKAIALAYYDWRVMVNRLDHLVGGRNWYAHLQPWGDHKLICTLTIVGVSKDSSGEGEADDENGGTSAEQQAKKRAMAEHGLNYLYLLPQAWGDYDAEKKRFINPQALVEEMYSNAHIEGLELKPFLHSTHAPSSASLRSITPGVATTTRPTDEINASITPPVNERVLQGIRKLCEALDKTEPEHATLTTQSAQRLFNQLSNEYKAARTRQATDPVSTP